MAGSLNLLRFFFGEFSYITTLKLHKTFTNCVLKLRQKYRDEKSTYRIISGYASLSFHTQFNSSCQVKIQDRFIDVYVIPIGADCLSFNFFVDSIGAVVISTKNYITYKRRNFHLILTY